MILIVSHQVNLICWSDKVFGTILDKGNILLDLIWIYKWLKDITVLSDEF